MLSNNNNNNYYYNNKGHNRTRGAIEESVVVNDD